MALTRATDGASATVSDPRGQMRCPLSISVPSRSSRSTDGSAERGSTTDRVLKKSVGLYPSAAPLLRLIRPASTYVLSTASQLKKPSRQSLIRLSRVTGARSLSTRTLARSLTVTENVGLMRHSLRTSINARACHVEDVDCGGGTTRFRRAIEPV